MSTRTGLSQWLSGKDSACWCRSHRRSGFDSWPRKISGEGNGNPLQYSLQGKFHEEESSATVLGLAKSRTQMSDWARVWAQEESDWVCMEWDLAIREDSEEEAMIKGSRVGAGGGVDVSCITCKWSVISSSWVPLGHWLTRVLPEMRQEKVAETKWRRNWSQGFMCGAVPQTKKWTRHTCPAGAASACFLVSSLLPINGYLKPLQHRNSGISTDWMPFCRILSSMW